jgi:hypothetical protein
VFAGLPNCIRGALQTIGRSTLLRIEARGDLHAGLAEGLTSFFLDLLRGRFNLLANAIPGSSDTTPFLLGGLIWASGRAAHLWWRG